MGGLKLVPHSLDDVGRGLISDGFGDWGYSCGGSGPVVQIVMARGARVVQAIVRVPGCEGVWEDGRERGGEMKAALDDDHHGQQGGPNSAQGR